MKLRIKVEPKDLMLFCIFAFFWLIVVQLFVVNINAFVDAEPFTFNIFLVFTDGIMFIMTIIGFLLGIAIALFSVKSHVFEMGTGVGLEVGAKREKNYSRWAKEKEMKAELKKVDPKAKHNDAAGIPIIMNEKEAWVDDGGYHNLVIGSTGAGKTQTTVLPMVQLLCKHDESMIITDPKGEIYEDTSEMLKDLGYNIVLLNFRDPQQGNSWNPMSLPYSFYKNGNQDKANELLDDLAKNILYDETSKGQDPFWENTSADYFAGLSLGLFEDANEDEINLNSINLMTTVGEEKIGNTKYVNEYFSYKDPTSPAYVNASSTIMAPNETRGSILSVFKQKIKLFASRENLSEMLAHNDFDMRDVGRKKTAVFIVIQDEKKTYHALVTIFLKQCYETLISVAQESGGKLPHRTNFILDEFANMPPLKDVTTMVTAARSRNIRFTFIIQNFAQLYEVYGKENGETIKGNCGNTIYLISSELSALEEISKMCGEVKSKEKEKTTSTPLVTVSDLQRLKQWETIVLRIRMMPFKTKLTPNFKMDWGVNYPKAKYPLHDKLPVKVFDLKGFVEKKREDKINNMLNGGGSPTGCGMPLGGFGGMPGGLPGMAGGFPGLPGMSGLPGGMPGGLSDHPSSPSGGNSFNIDEMVKRIDAKIAELEEEERQEKAKKENESIENESIGDELTENTNSDTSNKNNDSRIIDAKIEEIDNAGDVSSTTTKHGVTDDQFFDDFFSD